MASSVSPKKSKTSGLSSRQATRISTTMMLVLGSGILLTFLTYILLYLYISGIAQKKTDVQYREIRERIEEKVDRLISQMGIFTYLIKNGVEFRDIGSYLTQISPSARRRSYEQVLWLSVEPSVQIERVLYARPEADARLMVTLQNILLDTLKKNPVPLNGVMVPVFLDAPVATRNEVVNIGPYKHRMRYNYLAIVQSATRTDHSVGYLVGFLPFKNILYLDDLFEQGKRINLSLEWDQKGQVFKVEPGDFDHGTEFDSSSRDGGDINGRAIKLLGRNAMFYASIGQNYEQWILGEIPYAIPVIGLFLTLMGGFYVRNNQHQALMLTKMNKMLALKNMEMNSQVTERERLNHILRKTEQEKRAIMDSVSDIIFEIDQNGRFQFLNEAWYRVTGFPVEQSKGLNLFEMMPVSQRGEQRKLYDYILAGQKQAAAFSVGILSAGDVFRQMQIRYSMIRMDENNNQRVVGTMTDIEEFRRAESALAEAEEKYRAIWEHAVTGIYQVTVDGVLISANPALTRIFGYETSDQMVDEVMAMNRQLYGSPKDRQLAVNALMENGRINNIESQGKRRDGTTFWLAESARLVRDAEGNILYIEGSIDDITERKEAELRLKSAMTELELANRSKTEFLANMSHELRTPLNAIIGFSEIIRDEVFGRLEQQQYLDYARDIHESGKHLLGIINTILDVSRIEAGERQLNEMAIDIPRLARETVDMVRSRIDENMHILSFEIAEDLPKLWGEDLAIRQILLNLLTNAVKFTPTNGRITVSAQVDENGDLRLMVADTGIGLDDDEIVRVMAPFGQASGNFNRSSSGPGLGLTLVNSLTRLHGGHFEMISQKGVGTTAIVILPASRLQK